MQISLICIYCTTRQLFLIFTFSFKIFCDRKTKKLITFSCFGFCDSCSNYDAALSRTQSKLFASTVFERGLLVCMCVKISKRISAFTKIFMSYEFAQSTLRMLCWILPFFDNTAQQQRFHLRRMWALNKQTNDERLDMRWTNFECQIRFVNTFECRYEMNVASLLCCVFFLMHVKLYEWGMVSANE